MHKWFIFLLPCILVAAMPTITYEDLQDSRITLIKPGSTEFAIQLSKWNASDVGAISPLLPYSVIVRNGSGQAIVSLMVRYETRHPQSGQPISHYVQHEMAKAPVVPAGQSFFVSPHGPINRLVSQGKAAEVPALAATDIQKRLAAYVAQNSVRVSLDAVLLEDGSLLGPDKSRMHLRLAGIHRAEVDLKHATETDGIRAFLARSSKVAVEVKPPDQMTEADSYAEHLQSLSSRLQAVLEQSGEGAVREITSSLPRFPKVKRR